MTELVLLAVTWSLVHTVLRELLRLGLPVAWRPSRVDTHRAVVGVVILPTFVAFTAGSSSGALVALVYVGASVASALPEVLRFRALARALRELDEPSSAAMGLARMQRLIEKHPGRAALLAEYRRYAAFVHHVASEVASRGYLPHAFTWMSMVEPSALDFRSAASRAQSLAAWHIGNQDILRAKEELSRLTPPHPDPEWERALRAVGLLVRSIEGEDVTEGLDALEATESRRAVLLYVRQARAHVLATRGSTDEVRAQLEALRKEDPRLLAAVARHGGPSSAVAALLAEDKPVPYR